MPHEAIIADDAVTSGLPIFLQTHAARRHDWLGHTGGAIGQGLPCAVGAAVKKRSPGRKVLGLARRRRHGHVHAASAPGPAWRAKAFDVDRWSSSPATPIASWISSTRARAPAIREPAACRTCCSSAIPVSTGSRWPRGWAFQARRCDSAERFDAVLASAMAGRGPMLIEAALESEPGLEDCLRRQLTAAAAEPGEACAQLRRSTGFGAARWASMSMTQPGPPVGTRHLDESRRRAMGAMARTRRAPLHVCRKFCASPVRSAVSFLDNRQDSAV